jgi:hypothetical protein
MDFTTTKTIVGRGIELQQICSNSVNQSELCIKESGIDESLISVNKTSLKIFEYAPSIFIELRLLDDISSD